MKNLDTTFTRIVLDTIVHAKEQYGDEAVFISTISFEVDSEYSEAFRDMLRQHPDMTDELWECLEKGLDPCEFDEEYEEKPSEIFQKTLH